jgi:type I restriction enzyme M protein
MGLLARLSGYGGTAPAPAGPIDTGAARARQVQLPLHAVPGEDAQQDEARHEAGQPRRRGRGIATYIWVLTNRKPTHRKGKVQLIDATPWYKPLRKNLGKKNCELSEEDIQRICDTFLAFEETEQSKIFPNAAFGFWKVTVEQPLRLEGIAANQAYTPREIKELKAKHPVSEAAPPLIKKVHKSGKAVADPLRGLFEATVAGKRCVVEYESDSELRDTEQVPLLEPGGIEAFLRREVLPHAPDAWYDPESVKVGYEISFTRYFYKPQPLRTLEEIRADILALEQETEGLLDEILGKGGSA